MIWALIVITCTYGSDTCFKLTTYHATETACAEAVAAVRSTAEQENPNGVVIYRCEEVKASL